jgi:hypothetical protein
MSDEEASSCIRYPMACTVTWLHSPGFIPVGKLGKNSYIGIAHTQYRSWNVLFMMKLQP